MPCHVCNQSRRRSRRRRSGTISLKCVLHAAPPAEHGAGASDRHKTRDSVRPSADICAPERRASRAAGVSSRVVMPVRPSRSSSAPRATGYRQLPRVHKAPIACNLPVARNLAQVAPTPTQLRSMLASNTKPVAVFRGAMATPPSTPRASPPRVGNVERMYEHLAVGRGDLQRNLEEGKTSGERGRRRRSFGRTRVPPERQPRRVEPRRVGTSKEPSTFVAFSAAMVRKATALPTRR